MKNKRVITSRQLSSKVYHQNICTYCGSSSSGRIAIDCCKDPKCKIKWLKDNVIERKDFTEPH